jgi:hypothetical protein
MIQKADGNPQRNTVVDGFEHQKQTPHQQQMRLDVQIRDLMPGQAGQAGLWYYNVVLVPSY